ncbi:serine/threonine protein phosphatase [Pochonia chlamydosporia 170]|uniref:Serine/threonine protein phosphatase n=1 Tax=Pochonia chlamydosporia 170 TaxID=1380566 RepID=A0A179FUW2_METCM|nr:serine/threonine protein phosphatase [Pochonia chlamydosporia 170]OAQ69028.1 serine/threonine protein phosphatase [Pochonia chlamydosporia 170]
MAFRALAGKPPKGSVTMDPNCAICHAPATLACECEARGLEMAIRQAEDHMMRSVYNDIRSWVRGHAQDYVLEYFRLLTERRKNAHTTHLDQITAHSFYHYNAPPHPNQIAEAQGALKRGIDEDWQASVQRYPEVLEYFFGLVELSLPADDESAVKDPPLSALNGHRKATRRSLEGTGSGSGSDGRRAAPALAGTPFQPMSSYSGRDTTLDRRSSQPPSRRPPPPAHLPPPPSSYYGGGFR